VALSMMLSLAACGGAAKPADTAKPAEEAKTDAAKPAEEKKDDKAGKKIVVGFAQIGAESEWRTANTKSIKDACEKAGFELKFSDAQQKQENQIKAIRSFIAQKVDFIALAPVVETGWDTVLKEVADATFYSLINGKAMLYLDSLKTSGIETSSQTTYARGGKGNAKIVGFTSNKESKVTLQDCVFSNAGMAMMAGSDIITGANNVYKREVLTVSSNAVTVSKTPVGDPISVYKLLPDGTHGTEFSKAEVIAAGKYTIAAKVITFNTGELTNADKVVIYYKIATDETANKIVITADKFGGSFKLILDVLVRDIYTKQDFQGQIIIPNCKVEDSWNLSFSADGDPAVFDMPIEVLKDPTSTEMWELVVYDESLAV
jgi:hypothetical protein